MVGALVATIGLRLSTLGITVGLRVALKVDCTVVVLLNFKADTLGTNVCVTVDDVGERTSVISITYNGSRRARNIDASCIDRSII